MTFAVLSRQLISMSLFHITRASSLPTLSSIRTLHSIDCCRAPRTPRASQRGGAFDRVFGERRENALLYSSWHVPDQTHHEALL
ncbi:hypothetical protein V8C34DRAFT_276390, partial [Trichoderma compactum]